MPPLIYCFALGRVEINYCDGINGQTALHMACEADKPVIVKLLLDKNAGLLYT